MFLNHYAFKSSVILSLWLSSTVSPSPHPQTTVADGFPFLSLILPEVSSLKEIFLPTVTKCFLTGSHLIVVALCIIVGPLPCNITHVDEYLELYKQN